MIIIHAVMIAEECDVLMVVCVTAIIDCNIDPLLVLSRNMIVTKGIVV